MPIQTSSLAVATGAGVNNVNFTPAANDIARNIVIIGTFDPSLAGGITAASIYGPYSSAAQVGTKFGLGFMLHRLAIGVFAGLGSGGATVWVVPQAEASGAAATSVATLALTGPATAAGTAAIYVANIRYAVSVAVGDTATTIGDAIVAAMTADSACPVTGVNTTGNVVLTAKSKGPWGNAIPLYASIGSGEALPAGVGLTITALTGGTGVPAIIDALNALGTGSNANSLPNNQWMTELVHGYLATATVMATPVQDQTTITSVSTYNGLASASPPTGCYDHLVGKPFRCLLGDTTASTSVPSALLTLATTNDEDRTDGLVSVPSGPNHPCEIAAIAIGVIAKIAGTIAGQPYMGQVLPGVGVPTATGQWVLDYTNRDTAVKGGLSPVLIRGGYVMLQNVVSFYATNTGVPVDSNGYREFANISKLQNIIASMLSTFRSAKWKGISIVKDSAKVTDPVVRQTVRSVEDVIDELVGLANAWEAKGWLYSADNTIAALQAGGSVTVRAAGDGFTASFPGILSGIGNIIDTTFNFDINVAAA